MNVSVDVKSIQSPRLAQPVDQDEVIRWTVQMTNVRPCCSRFFVEMPLIDRILKYDGSVGNAEAGGQEGGIFSGR